MQVREEAIKLVSTLGIGKSTIKEGGMGKEDGAEWETKDEEEGREVEAMIGGQVLEVEGENEKKEGIDREIGIEGEWESKRMDKGINKKETRR